MTDNLPIQIVQFFASSSIHLRILGSLTPHGTLACTCV